MPQGGGGGRKERPGRPPGIGMAERPRTERTGTNMERVLFPKAYQEGVSIWVQLVPKLVCSKWNIPAVFPIWVNLVPKLVCSTWNIPTVFPIWVNLVPKLVYSVPKTKSPEGCEPSGLFDCHPMRWRWPSPSGMREGFSSPGGCVPLSSRYSPLPIRRESQSSGCDCRSG